jgi:hypothetical protein
MIGSLFHFGRSGFALLSVPVKSLLRFRRYMTGWSTGWVTFWVRWDTDRVKIHKITPTTGKERGDLEIKDYVVLQKPQEQPDCLPPPRTLIMDLTLTHTCFGRSHVYSTGHLTLWTVTRKRFFHYHQLYINRSNPIAFMPLTVDTSVRIYDDFNRLLFLHAHRETSVLANEIPDESDQFRFLHTTCLVNLKGSVGLILAKVSG